MTTDACGSSRLGPQPWSSASDTVLGPGAPHVTCRATEGAHWQHCWPRAARRQAQLRGRGPDGDRCARPAALLTSRSEPGSAVRRCGLCCMWSHSGPPPKEKEAPQRPPPPVRARRPHSSACRRAGPWDRVWGDVSPDESTAWHTTSREPRRVTRGHRLLCAVTAAVTCGHEACPSGPGTGAAHAPAPSVPPAAPAQRAGGQLTSDVRAHAHGRWALLPPWAGPSGRARPPGALWGVGARRRGGQMAAPLGTRSRRYSVLHTD